MKLSAFLPLLLSACVVPVAVPLPKSGNPVPQQIYGQWQITRLNDQKVSLPQAVVSIYSVNPQFMARTDCNQIFGHYETNAETKSLSFTGIASTRMACDNMDIERLLGQVLPQVKSYRFEGNRIEMLDGTGHIVLQGKRAS